MGRFSKSSFEGLLVVAIWQCISLIAALPAVSAKDMVLHHGAHTLIAQHIASARGASGHEKRAVSKHEAENSDLADSSLNGKYEDIDKMPDNTKSYAWLPNWVRHLTLAVIFALAGLVVGWMVLQLAHMQGFKQEGPEIPIGGMILFLLMGPFTNFFDDLAMKLPGLQQMVPYTDLAHESQREFIPVRSGAFGLTLELPQPFMVMRTLVDKTWITSLLYSRREGSYSLAYSRVPSYTPKDTMHEDIVVWDVGHSLDVPEPTKYETTNYDIGQWLDRLATLKIKKLGAVNTTVTPIALYNRYPGRSIAGKLPDGNAFEMHIYTSSVNLYTLLVTGTDQWVKSSDAALFLDSFNLD
jgi:hypothetical protein